MEKIGKEKLKLDILKLLKKYAVVKDENKFSNKNEFYYNDYLDNLFERKMNEEDEKSFINASGNEIEVNKNGLAHMASLGSSSALLYNVLSSDNNIVKVHENHFGIPQNEYYVTFEKKLKGLGISNIDAMLESVDQKTVILIENKMLEILEKQNFIISSYLNKERYQTINDLDIQETYYQIFKNICNEEVTKKDKKGYEYIKKKTETVLDIFQLIKHTLGFICERSRDKFEKVDNVILIHTFYMLPYQEDTKEIFTSFNKLIGKMGDEEDGYIESIYKPIKELYKRKNIDFSYIRIPSINFALQALDLDFDRKNYLYNRYSFKSYIYGKNVKEENGYNLLEYISGDILLSPYKTYFPNNYEYSSYLIKLIKYVRLFTDKSIDTTRSFLDLLSSEVINKIWENKEITLMLGFLISRDVIYGFNKRYEYYEYAKDALFMYNEYLMNH